MIFVCECGRNFFSLVAYELHCEECDEARPDLGYVLDLDDIEREQEGE